MILEFITYRKWLLATTLMLSLISLTAFIIHFNLIGFASCVFVVILIKFLIKKFYRFLRLKSWINKNPDKTVLFYPGTKKRQRIIANEVAPIFNSNFSVYIEGKTLIGDLNREVVYEMMNYYGLEENKPALIGINGQKLSIEEFSGEMDLYIDKSISSNEFVKRIQSKIIELQN